TRVAGIVSSAVGTHDRIPHLRRPPARRREGIGSAFHDLRETLGNRSFLALFCSGVFGAMAAGLTAALGIYFFTYFWELTPSQISVFVLSGFVSAVFAVAAATPLSRRVGKKASAIGVSLVALIVAPAPVALRLFGWLPPHGAPSLLVGPLALNRAP